MSLFHCGSGQLCEAIRHPSGTEWVCQACGNQTDFFADDYEEIPREPHGCCESCDTNLYGDEGPLCSQCEWELSIGTNTRGGE